MGVPIITAAATLSTSYTRNVYSVHNMSQSSRADYDLLTFTVASIIPGEEIPLERRNQRWVPPKKSLFYHY